jgi:hypothetical protein
MRHEEFDKRFPAWLNDFLNKWPWCLDEDSIKSFAIVWGFKREGKWVWIPERAPNDGAQFYNGIACLRLNWPIGIFFQVRWSGSTTRKSLLQCGIGWKVIGRIGLVLRVQSDESSAVGYNTPNTGQAQGWDYGPH